jgi:hypothetical protein
MKLCVKLITYENYAVLLLFPSVLLSEYALYVWAEVEGSFIVNEPVIIHIHSCIVLYC